MEKPTQLLGQPKETVAHEQRWHGPDNGVAHAGLPPQLRRLTRGACASARQTGERRKTTAQLAAGGFSGEDNGANVFASPKRTKGNPLLQLTTQLEGVMTSTVAHGHGRAGSGELTASQPQTVTLRASSVLLRPSARQRKGWEGHSGGCPRGATMPVRSAMAAVEEQRRFALTEARLDRR